VEEVMAKSARCKQGSIDLVTEDKLLKMCRARCRETLQEARKLMEKHARKQAQGLAARAAAVGEVTVLRALVSQIKLALDLRYDALPADVLFAVEALLEGKGKRT
jgi:hypothetical protein